MLGTLSKVLTSSLGELVRGDGGWLALDVGSSSVKLLELDRAPGSLRVRAFGAHALPASAVQNNRVREPEAVASVIRLLLEESGASAVRTITVIPGPAVILKKLRLPAQAPRELEASILFEAGNLIPESLDNVHLDYAITDVLEKERQYEVLLVAVKKDILDSYVSAIRMAGLEPAVVDVDYFALENMFALNHPPAEHEVAALINVGARYSCMNILRARRSTFTGDVPVGGKELNDALMRSLGVTFAEAEAIKLGDLRQHAPERVEAVLHPAKELLAEEIHRALSFFGTAATDESIGSIYLSGGAARIPGLATLLADRLEVPVRLADPFAKVTFARGVDRAAVGLDAARYAIAIGLGARGPGEA